MTQPNTSKSEMELSSELLFERLFEFCPDGALVAKSDGEIIRANRQAEKLFGYERGELDGRTIEVLVPERFRDRHPLFRRGYMGQVGSRPMTTSLEACGRRKDGSEFSAEILLNSVLEAGSEPLVLSVVRDITERKRAEETLRESEEKFRQITDNIREVFWITTLDFHQVLYVSPAYEEIWGRTCRSLYERPLDWLESIHPEDRERVQSKFAEALEKKEKFDFEYRVLRPDSSLRHIHDQGYPVLDEAGRPYRLAGTATDITERKRAEEALHQREQLLESILDNTTAVVYVKDREGRIQKVNHQYEVIFGVAKDQVIGKSDYDLFPKEMADRWRANDRKVLETGTSIEFEEVAPREDGLHTYISIKFPIFDAAGKPSLVCGISTDITERKRAEASLLLEMMNVLVSNLDVQKLFGAIAAAIQQAVPHEYSSLALYDANKGNFRVRPLTTEGGQESRNAEFPLDMDRSIAGWVFKSREPVVFDRLGTSRLPAQLLEAAKWLKQQIERGSQSVCWVPLLHRNNVMGVLVVAAQRENAFGETEVRFLTQLASQIAIALDNAIAYGKIAESMDRLEQEKLYLEDELKTEYNFEEIVGESAPLKRVLKQAETVAKTDSTVLILGETGTGKELIARAIHNLSPRRGRTFVRLNCAAIPSGLLESELFGHEKGAFTGALARKIGRLELAHGGTLLLDEVGDIPLELQPKLLRALQEKEFERLGSNRTIPVDVRLIASTNRDLTEMVKDGRFRRDLYYRLRVFPITLPPLRQRREDIPLLAHYFLQKHAERIGRPIRTIPPEAMQALTAWQWPGNVRELENFIERAVILSRGPELRVPLSELRSTEGEADTGSATTLQDVEREHIVQVLRETRGVIAGPNGAAARLGLKRTTLNFKIRKLGINRQDL